MLLSLIATLSTLPLAQVSDAEIWRRLDLYPSYPLLCRLEEKRKMSPILKARVDRVKFPLVRRSIYLRVLAFQDLPKAKLVSLARVAAEKVSDESLPYGESEMWRDRRDQLNDQLFLSYQWPLEAQHDWVDGPELRLALRRPIPPHVSIGGVTPTAEAWQHLASIKNPRRYFESCDEEGLVPREDEQE